jgi:hypothetical protein
LSDSTLTIRLNSIAEALTKRDFLFIDSEKVLKLLSDINGEPAGQDPLFLESWNTLEQDQYMADGGSYRKRRHATYATWFAGESPRLMPHQPHYQTVDYNPLNGGVARYFSPILGDLHQSRTLNALLDFGAHLFGGLSGNAQWHIELHQFRIEARDGQHGKPTPEGVHRDGVDFVMVVMINRVNINSGTTTIYNLDHELIGEFTLQDSFDLVLVNDRKLYHGVTSIEQIDGSAEAYRDVLVITFRQK